jgi:flagellar protein FliO/FliZ
MIRSQKSSRAAVAAALLVLGLAALAFACPAQAFKPSTKAGGENTPLDVSTSGGSSHASSGPSIVRTIVGLLIVIAVIWGLSWILKQVKSGRSGRAAGSGLASLATLPLGSGRSLHLVRAGSDYLIVGTAEHGVVPIQRYSEEQALEAGLIEPGGGPGDLAAGGAGDAEGAFAARRRGPVPARPAKPGAAGVVDRLREWSVRR